MKKHKLSDFEKLAVDGYKRITSVPVYCKLCGQEILWVDSPTGREKTRAEYESEMRFEVHTECYNKYLNANLNR